MQKYAKKIDSRSFKEIYESFSDIERTLFRTKAMDKGIRRESMWRWLNTGATPLPAHKKIVKDVLRDYLNLVTNTESLFPA